MNLGILSLNTTMASSLSTLGKRETDLILANLFVMAHDFTFRHKFNSLDEIAMHCQDNNIPGLKFRLGQICQKPRPAAFNQIGNATGRWVISPEDVVYSEADRLGGGQEQVGLAELPGGWLVEEPGGLPTGFPGVPGTSDRAGALLPP